MNIMRYEGRTHSSKLHEEILKHISAHVAEVCLELFCIVTNMQNTVDQVFEKLSFRFLLHDIEVTSKANPCFCQVFLPVLKEMNVMYIECHQLIALMQQLAGYVHRTCKSQTWDTGLVEYPPTRRMPAIRCM